MQNSVANVAMLQNSDAMLQNYVADNVANVANDVALQNLNININTNIKNNIDIDRIKQLKEEFCADGYSKKLDDWINEDNTLTRKKLYDLDYSEEEIDYVFSQII